MKRILLISDTHSHIDGVLIKHISAADEVWHAGDIGSINVINTIKKLKPLRAVYGNIDDALIRKEYTEDLIFICEDVKVYMTHICGRSTNYLSRVKEIIRLEHPKLFICGHTHILKVMYQENYQLLHLNPGACGKHGFHQIRTALRFIIDGNDIKDLAIIELGKRV